LQKKGKKVNKKSKAITAAKTINSGGFSTRTKALLRRTKWGESSSGTGRGLKAQTWAKPSKRFSSWGIPGGGRGTSVGGGKRRGGLFDGLGRSKGLQKNCREKHQQEFKKRPKKKPEKKSSGREKRRPQKGKEKKGASKKKLQ